MKKESSFKSKGDYLFYAVMALFPTVQFSLMYVGVNVNSIKLAFVDNVNGQFVFVGFKHFAEIFSSGETALYLTYMKNSLIVYVIGLVVGTPLSLIFAFYIYKQKIGSGIFKVVLYLPQIISVTVLVVMFKNIVNEAYMEIIYNLFGVFVNPLLLDQPFYTILIFTILISRGTGVLMYTGALSGISDSVVESAKLDGALPFNEFIYISLPSIFPTLSTFLIVGVAGIFVEQMNLFSFYGVTLDDYKIKTMGYYLYQQIKHWDTPETTYPLLSALGLVLTAITAVLTFIYKRVLDRIDPTR